MRNVYMPRGIKLFCFSADARSHRFTGNEGFKSCMGSYGMNWDDLFELYTADIMYDSVGKVFRCRGGN